MQYIKAMRPFMGIFSSLLCLAAFHLQSPSFIHEHLLQITPLLIAIFCGVSATMVWNDFIDQKHDLKKHKYHAHEHRSTYAIFALILWLITGFCCVIISNNKFGQPWLFILILFLFCTGLCYSFTYRIPLLSMIVVGLASASPTLFALLNPPIHAPLLGIALFTGVALAICAREILKDIEDAEIDRGRKKTIPVLWGAHRAQLCSAGILLIASIALAPITLGTALTAMPLLLFGCGSFIVFFKQPCKVGKLAIDMATVILLVTLFLF